MGQPVLHKLLIGTLLVGLVVSGLMLFLSGGVTTYGMTDYNNTSMSKVSSAFTDIQDATNATQEKLMRLQTQEGDQNKLDLFFTQAYDGAKTIGASMSALFTITDAGLSDTTPGLGVFGGTMKLYFMLMILIVFIIGFLMYFIIGKDRV
jgi:hypothetical protein